MKQIMLNTSELKKSDSNVRKGHSKEDIHMMANSIKARGIILPPLVAKNGDGRTYEIIAGNLRVAGAIAAGIKKINCIDVGDTPEEERIALSLSENVVRRQMSAIETYRAFDKLYKAGTSVEQIASQFSATQRRVYQLLAIGSLPKKILDQADAGDLGDDVLEVLAIAPKAEQRRYARLSIKDRPRNWQVQEWLDGSAGRYRLAAAIFDPELYTGSRITDLFAKEDEVWLTDGAMFMELQNAALKNKLAEFEKKGWKHQEIDYWQSYGYEKKAKAKGGMVFWCRSIRTGLIEFHVGYKRLGKAGPAAKTKGAEPEKQPEISQAFSAYIRQVRHNGVRAELLDDSKIALVVNICCLLKQHDNFRLDNIGMGAVKGEAYETSIAKSLDYASMEEEFLKVSKETNPTKLYKMSEKELLNRLATITAWRWQAYGNEFSDQVAKAINLIDVHNWEPSEVFWKGIKNKVTLITIAKQLKVIHARDATATAIRKLLIMKVKANGWRPKWLKF